MVVSLVEATGGPEATISGMGNNETVQRAPTVGRQSTITHRMPFQTVSWVTSNPMWRLDCEQQAVT